MLETTKQSQAVNATSGLLVPEQAATVLHCKPIDVMRLIARGDLEANRLKGDGPFLIRQDAIDRYAAGDVAGFVMPPIDPETGWFRQEWFGYRALVESLRTAFEGSGQIREALEFDAQNQPITDHALTLTAAVRSILDRPVLTEGAARQLVTGQAVNTFRTDIEYRSAAEVAMADWYRRTGSGYLRREVKTPKLAGELAKLYQSPEVYGQVVGYCQRTYAEGSFSITRVVRDPRGDASLAPKDVRVTYRLPFASIYSDTARLAFLAF